MQRTCVTLDAQVREGGVRSRKGSNARQVAIGNEGCRSTQNIISPGLLSNSLDVHVCLLDAQGCEAQPQASTPGLMLL